MQITVVNKRHKGRNSAVYIGRGGQGVAGSPLANPRRLGDPRPGGGTWERGEMIDLFDRDLRRLLDRGRPVAEWWDGRAGCYRPLSDGARDQIRDEIDRLVILARHAPLELDCFCAPRRCHGDTIRQIVLERLAAR